VDKIKRLNKVIIYMIHPDVGHLGIFVGSKAAKKEHMQIIKSIDFIEALAPGLYEMIIVDKGKKEKVSDYDVRFEERDIEDLMALNADKETMKAEDADFSRVAAVSELNDWLYNTFASPWVKMFSTATSARIMKQLHPLRVNKYIFADRINPCMSIFKALAPVVKKNRGPVSPDNPLAVLEKNISDNIVAMLDSYQGFRDHFTETLFFAIYDNPWMKLLLPETSRKKKSNKEQAKEQSEEAVQVHHDKQHWHDAMGKGGYEEGLIRIVMALEASDHAIDRDALYRDERLLASGERFKQLDKKEFMRIAGEQSRILQIDEDKAFKSLARLIASPKDRRSALTVAKKVVLSGKSMSKRQKEVLSRISQALPVK
jgi:Protein of unknown function (DUF3141)